MNQSELKSIKSHRNIKWNNKKNWLAAPLSFGIVTFNQIQRQLSTIGQQVATVDSVTVAVATAAWTQMARDASQEGRPHTMRSGLCGSRMALPEDCDPQE